MIDALLQLGQEQRIPIGIEYIDAAAFRSRISPHEQDTTLGRLLDTITHGQGYSWFTVDNVVMVTHNGAPRGRKNLLTLRIPEFTIEREVTLQAASLKLLGGLYFALNPHSTGIVGDYPSGNPKFRVGPLRMKNATVRQILNRIVFAAQQRRVGRTTSAMEYGKSPALWLVAGVRVRWKQWGEIHRTASGLGIEST